MFSLEIHDLKLEIKDGKNTRLLFHLPEYKVNSGSSVAVCGSSGSGKTTFMRLITGIQNSTSGEIIWKNSQSSVLFSQLSDSQKTSWRRENAGIIFQDFQLIPTLSVLENVLLPFTFRSFTLKQSHKEEGKKLLESVGITQFSQKVQSLSRGEMQRVAFCRAVVTKPFLLFADEPTASLDKENTDIIHNLLLDYSKNHDCTLFVITHDKEYAKKTDYILPLEKGRQENI